MPQNTQVASGRQIDYQPYFGGFILETLTIGMYGDSRNAIREYLQNGFDSIQRAIEDELISSEEAVITITMSDDGLIIRDNGTGLSKNIAVSTLTAIGASSKNYRREAGFRGIGRLAGIVFCNELTFTTKAAGESSGTRVVLDAAGLRRDMSPLRGGHLPLNELLQNHVRAFEIDGPNIDDHYFEVALMGYKNAPAECTNMGRMIDFVSQIAPVPYDNDFAFAERIHAEAERRNKSIDTVRILVVNEIEETEVFKPYGKEFPVGKDAVTLSKCEFHDSPSKHWWGWIGQKTEPGAYKDERSKAIRVRVRNIQIDDTQIIGQIFESGIPSAPSYGRFNDWFVGEIFVEPTFLVPNARRDGFEDDENWQLMREELASLCASLGKTAYDISKRNQHSISKLTQDTRSLEAYTKSVVASENPSADKLIELSNDVTKLQRRVSRAVRHADLEVTSQLRSLDNRLLDVKTKAVRKLGVAQLRDPNEVREQAQQEVISALMKAFRTKLDPQTYARVARIASEVLGTTDF